MRMEVGEASATAAAAEGAVGPDAAQKAVERIRELEAERQQWIAKRQQTLARQEKLLKLLELQRATKSKGEQNAGDTANNETKTPPADDQKTENEEARTAAATAALARKKELKELQARALAAQEKQQQAASVLARNLKQLVTRNAQRSQAIKRKREEEQEAADNQPSKKIDVGVDKDEATASTPEMHPFAAGSDVDVGTTELAAAACFRIALRHLVQTGTVMSKEKLEQEFNTYTGKQSGEVIDSSLLEFSLADVNTVGSIQAGNPSSSSTRVEPVCWQPGRQYLKIPTVCSSQADRIQALIDVEKQVVVDACDSLWMEKRCLSSTSVICKRRQKQFMACLLGEDVAAPNSATLSTVLSACVGVNPNRSTTSYEKRFPYQVYGQIASVFAKMEAWLRDRATKSEPNNSLSLRLDEGNRHRSSRDNFFSSKYAKPFSVSSDSVVKQLRDIGSLHSAVAKKLDPMKILCHYELNGVCNDKNCSNYHQNDYEPVVINSKESSDGNDGDDFAKVLQMDEMDQLLLSFAEFRGRIMTKWPVIPTSQNSSVTTEKNTGTNATDARLSAIEPELSMARDSQRRDGDSEGSNDDFLELDIPAELPALGDARYFDDVESRNLYGDSLQGKVEEDPNDTDAWLLLAIYYLDLDVGLSDEAANLSGDDRLQQQLVFLCKELNVVHRSGSSRKLNIEESNLKRCLHTLSRALEVEANAYCEALWLLYLHLCGQVASKQTEIDTVEQAVQFLPSSHALWLRYVSTYDFDSVGMAEGIYWRLLEHLARVNSGEDGLQVSNVSPKKELSILLTAICFHLCIKLWRAGATRRVLELLSALLQIGDATSEFAWCNMVRGQLRGDETIVICLVFAHALLFNEVPKVIEYWVAASSYESVPIKGMAYTIESLESNYSTVDEDVLDRVLVAYNLAFQTHQSKCRGVQEAGGVILSNWMLLLAFQHENDKRDEPLRSFFENKLDMIQRSPAASLTAAKLMMLKPSGEQQAHRLMLLMMNQSSQVLFPEALHHYLFACRQSSALVNALDKAFPDVMQRLARLLSADIDKVEKSIQDIMHDTSNISKARALNALLYALLAAWMDQLAVRHREFDQELVSNQPANPPDIYEALDICLLMGILLEPSAAIDGLQMVLSSSYFGFLSLEARQLAWMQRFILEVDLLQHDHVDSFPWREHQAGLAKLFRKYMSEMSVEAQMFRQVSKQIKDDVERNAVEDAVCDCLYPERHQLITYDVNIELFRLCLAAVAGSEQTTFYASFTDSLGQSSEFSLAFSDAAVHEWELLAARASLRKCLGRAKAQHPQILQALVAVELRLRNMKAVSSLLESEMQAEPLLLESWRLAVGLEILFGEQLDERSQKIAAEMEKRQLVFACNTYGDDKLSSEGTLSMLRNSEATSLSLRGLRLTFVPNAVLLNNELVSLNLSGNELTELPMGLGRLKNLRKLDASENGLIGFPECVNKLTQLQELRLAHNNIYAVSIHALPRLITMDIRWNAIAHLSASTLAALQNLIMLHIEGNAVPDDQLAKFFDLLSRRKHGIASREDQTNSIVQTEEIPRSVLAGDKSLPEKPSHKKVTLSSADANTEVADKIIDSEMTAAEVVATELETKEDDGDQVVEQDIVSTVSASKDKAGQLTENVDQTSPPIESNEDQAMSAADTATVSMEGGDDQSMGNSNSVIEIDDAIPVSVGDATKEVIDVDSSESAEETEDSNNITELTVDATRDVLVPSTNAEPSGSSATGNFERSHSDAVLAAAPRRHSSIARTKLAVYMKNNHVDGRAEARRRNPALWGEFVAANLPVQSVLPACRWCFAPNDGRNQRFNSTVLCVRCLEDAVRVLKEREGSLDVGQNGF